MTLEYKKRIRCVFCKRWVIVNSFNRLKCDECGYKDQSKSSKENKANSF